MGEEQLLQADRAGRQALIGFEVAIVERQAEIGDIEKGCLRTGGLRLARRETGQPGIERVPAHRSGKHQQSWAHRRTIFPGFMMFFGSSARLMARIAGSAEGCSASSQCILP